MAVEVTSESTQMAEEPFKDSKDEGAATEDVKVGKENGEFKKEDEPKATMEAAEEKKFEGETGEGSSSSVIENGELKKEDEPKTGEVVEEKKFEGEASSSSVIERSDSFKEESNLLSDLKEHERKALIEIRSMLEEAILGNKLFKEKKRTEDPKNEKLLEGEERERQAEGMEMTNPKGEEREESEEKDKTNVIIDEKRLEMEKGINIITLWGVPLLPSKGDKGTDVLLLKFLRAREFKADEAFEMLRNTLQWRKELKIDSILEEDLGADFGLAAYMSGVDREGHPVCYNVYGVFGNDEIYRRTLGTEESREKFLRWRFQLMEKGIQELDFRPGGVSSLLQISDLKNTPGPSRKELRLATKRAVGLLQDNYPEFVARNIFINVPFWYYAFNALLSPFLTQRTKSKFVLTRPARVTETLLKYIAAEEIPVHYGGLKRDNDSEFSTEDTVSEVAVKAGSTETIEIPAPEVGTTLVWDLTVLGWEVNYKEEFVPTDEGSYAIIVKKGRKMGGQEGTVRNSFTNNEAGKVVLTIENGSFKKKRALYRYKTKNI
uniref:Patellin-4 n=1 Tax=Davidia involucrata TaxID=16924 RepID=A0A5B7BQ70_DAVIN